MNLNKKFDQQCFRYTVPVSVSKSKYTLLCFPGLRISYLARQVAGFIDDKSGIILVR
jgi:hypothetical protein